MLVRLLAGLVLTTAGCGQAPDPPPFDGEAALAYARTQLEFGYRIPGTEGHRRMGDWLDSTLRARADEVLVQSWDHTAADGSALPLRNFIARFNPAAADRILLVAHWDTRPIADAPDSRDSAAVPGANDGASGVAVLLGVADVLKAHPAPIGVDLLFVDGEDYGSFAQERDVLLGSKYYAKNPAPGPTPLFAVVFDMVGDADLQIYQESYSLTGAPEIVDRVWQVAADLGYREVFIPQGRHTITDDHIPLQEVGIRAIDLIDFDYPHWHTVEDTIDKLSARSLGIVGHVALGVIWRGR